MAFAHGSDGKLLVNSTDLSPYIHTITPHAERAMHETTTFGKTARTYTPGLPDGKLGGEGFWDGEIEGIDEILADALTAQVNSIVTGAYNTLAIGRRIVLCASDVSHYGVQSPTDDMTQVNVEFQPTGGLEFGVSLWDVETTATGSANGTSVDNAASSANGAVAHLHLTNISGAGASATVKVQHSTNNSTWVDLITFTAAVASGAQRAEVTGTVNRYLRAIVTISGTTPSVSFAVAVARR